MKRYVILSFVSLATIVVFSLAGCDAGKPRNSAPAAKNPPVIAEEPVNPQPQKEPERELVAIGENVTGKADFAEGGDRHIMAPILVPLGQYFSVKERTVFEMQIPKAVSLYRAANDNKLPATHEDYMRDIVQANSIILPKLRNPTDEYQYDPESGELMISTVKK